MHKMHKIKDNVKLSDIEASFKDLYKKENKNIDIQLPEQLNNEGGFGIDVAIMQFVSTLSRLSPDSALVLDSNKKEYLSDFLKKPYSLVSAYMLNNHKVGKENKDITNKNDTLIYGLNSIDAMQNYDFQKTMDGKGVLLSCFAGAKNEFLKPLYKKPNYEGLRGTLDFEKVTQEIIGAYSPDFIKSLSKDKLFSISTMFRELFENTNDHSSGTGNDNKFDWNFPSFRAIFAKSIVFDDISEESFKRYSGQDKPLRTFFLNNMIDSSEERMEFIEVSIIDSGIGIAKNWHTKKHSDMDFSDITIDVEESYIKKAFKLRKTTKSVPQAGIGLDSVVRHLNGLNAFIRLRTGRVCLYQDFSKSNSDQDFSPKHWDDDNKELCRSEGTSYTILIPCRGTKTS